MSVKRRIIESINKRMDFITESNTVFHFGDLGTGNDTYLGRMGYGTSRSTGHFGTGTYFVKNTANYSNHDKRPVHRIDLDKYKLFKPKTEDNAFKLHDILRKVNGLVSYYYFPDEESIDDNDLYDYLESHSFSSEADYLPYLKRTRYTAFIREYNKIRESLSSLVGSVPNMEWFYDNTQKKVMELNQNPSSKENSLSTDLMIRLGYNGINVSDLPQLDNGTYGTVVYKL